MSARTPLPQIPASVEAPALPTGVQLTPMDPIFRQDPYPVLERLRSAERIHRDVPLGRWFVTGFEETREILRNKDHSSNMRNAAADSYMGRVWRNAQAGGLAEATTSILYMDDPEHRRVRALVSKPFTPKAVEDLRPRIRANVAELLDTLTEPHFDLVKRLPVPCRSLSSRTCSASSRRGMRSSNSGRRTSWRDSSIHWAFRSIPNGAPAPSRSSTNTSPKSLPHGAGSQAPTWSAT